MPKTKIFCDIADSKTIKEFNKKKLLMALLLIPAYAKSWSKEL